MNLVKSRKDEWLQCKHSYPQESCLKDSHDHEFIQVIIVRFAPVTDIFRIIIGIRNLTE
jgi:hypothetical protein